MNIQQTIREDFKQTHPHIDEKVFDILAQKYDLFNGSIGNTSEEKPVLCYVVNQIAQKQLRGNPDILLISHYNSINSNVVFGSITYVSCKLNPETGKFDFSPRVRANKDAFSLCHKDTGILLKRKQPI